jgi:putative drug exporter of the RND superfamily
VRLRALSRLSVRHRWPLVGLWLAALVVGATLSVRGPGLHANALTVPGSESARAQELLERELGQAPRSSFTVVFPGADEDDERRLRARLERAAARLGPGRVVDLREVGAIVHARLESGLEPDAAKAATPRVRAALRDSGDSPALVSGWPALEHDLERTLARDLRRGELVAVPLALAALLLVLGLSAAALLPLLVAAATVGGTLALLVALAAVVPIPSLAANLVWLIGLALAIDYSLLYLFRFREARARGDGVEAALEEAAERGGRAVLFSGLAVAAGLGLLALIPVPLVAALGVAGVAVALVALAAALTLLPALTSLLGGRVQPRRRAWTSLGDDAWERFARVLLRRPVAVALASTALLALAALPLARIELAPGSLAGLPPSLESVAAADALHAEAGAGALLPTLVVLDSRRPGGTRDRAFVAAGERLTERLVVDEEPLLVASGPRPPWTDQTRRYSLLLVGGVSGHEQPSARAFVSRLRERYLPSARYPAGTEALVGGAPAQGADFLARSYGSLPPLLLLLVVVNFLLLARAFRSLLLPLKALLLNAVSVAAACGVLVAVFQWGWGAGPLGVDAIGAIEAWVPLFLFAALFGLSLDYELFLVLRMREGWEATHDNGRAIALGLARSGRIVTAAALVMLCAFSGFLVADVVALQQLGVGLLAGIVIDATLVRALLLPSLMAVLGRFNWWLPAPLARVVAAPPAPLRASGSEGAAPGPGNGPP